MIDRVGEHDAGSHWEQVANEWTDWARAPGHDAYWYYRDSFREFLPGPGATTLEIGCGEGRIARDLTSLGHDVTATDISPSLLAAAEAAGSARRYLVADAMCLPFDDGAFDRVVAYNVLMDVPDMGAAVAEAARVLADDGLLTMSIVHPFVDRGSFDGTEPDAPFVVPGTYFGRSHFTGTEVREGRTMHFAGWSHPLEDYAAALQAAGLVITALREPRPARLDGHDAALAQWERMPLFLWINAAHVK
jgi:SAM-dependent methyltransferase